MLIWDHQNNCLLTECHHTIAAHQHLHVCSPIMGQREKNTDLVYI